MLAILTITLPIFLLISTGYIARWSGVIQREQMQGVTIFVLYCALPALIIRALTQHPLEEIFKLNYLIAYGIGSLLIFGGGATGDLAVSAPTTSCQLDTSTRHGSGQ